MNGASLNVPEARAILIADEALELSYEERLNSGLILGIAEGDAWRSLVEQARARIAEYGDTAVPDVTPYPGGNESDFQPLFVEAMAAGKKSRTP